MFFNALLPITGVWTMSSQTALRFAAFPRTYSIILRRLLESSVHNYHVSHFTP